MCHYPDGVQRREHIERVQACGAAGYLTKPFEAEKILPTIELCIARSKSTTC